MTSQKESVAFAKPVIDTSASEKDTGSKTDADLGHQSETKDSFPNDKTYAETTKTESTKDKSSFPAKSETTNCVGSNSKADQSANEKLSSPTPGETVNSASHKSKTDQSAKEKPSSAPPKSDATNSDGSKSKNNGESAIETTHPSMNFSIFTFWVLPVLLLSIFGRQGVDTDMPSIPEMKKNGGPSIQFDNVKLAKAALDYDRKKQEFDNKYRPQSKPASSGMASSTTSHQQSNPPVADNKLSSSTTPVSKSTSPSMAPSIDTSSWPSSYKATVDKIHERRSRWQNNPYKHQGGIEGTKAKQASVSPQGTETTSNSENSAQSTQSRRVQSSDPQRQRAQTAIAEFQKLYEKDKTDVFNAIQYAEAMRLWQQTYFDGGSYDKKAIEVYRELIQIIQHLRTQSQQRNIPTDVSQSGLQDVAKEVRLPFEEKSLDGLLCAVYTSLGKLYFVANMFEASEEAYNGCVDIEPHYLDAVHARGSTRIVLNKYAEAAQDFSTAIVRDEDHLFSDAFSGLVRVLEADEASVPFGWEFVVGRLNALIPQFESTIEEQTDARAINALSNPLRRFHHAMFVYHERKTKDYNAAWDHLTKAHHFKHNTLPSFPYGSERAKLDQIKTVFQEGFWPSGLGSPTRAPIFVIGFARSGSTLLERILDAHPQIFGMSENSVFNGSLESVRQRIVEASVTGETSLLPKLTEEMADNVVADMHERWRAVDSSSSHQGPPARFVDKMLTNYMNIGLIQMLYPNALILHVIREPMDTIFSCFKHDFPADRLAYTGNSEALAELYNTYRDTMIHWDDVLPGRVTHVRYEDLVYDTPGLARAIIESTGLPWDESVLDFHNKKQYVNTYSTTQVRKKVYKDGIHSWKKYEDHLQPLVNLLGAHVTYDQATTVPGYTKPVSSSSQHDEL